MMDPVSCKAAGSEGSGKQRALKAPRLALLIPTACLALAVGSVALSLLVTFRSQDMESRLHALEKDRAACAPVDTRTQDGTVPEQSAPPVMTEELRELVETIVQERLGEVLPKIRLARDLTQECNCPPGRVTGDQG
ncbi:hypothetical protein SRHO_G00125410 [Serrasalmus rhombeus]